MVFAPVWFVLGPRTTKTQTVMADELPQIGTELMSDPSRPSGKGLYDPAFEHDSCGVGFIARLDARPDHAVIRDAVEILVNLEHRGAVGGDKATGDGVGLLVQIPDALFQEECRESGFALPDRGGYGVGMIFLPRDDALARKAVRVFESICEQEGCRVLGWRKVPVDPDPLG